MALVGVELPVPGQLLGRVALHITFAELGRRTVGLVARLLLEFAREKRSFFGGGGIWVMFEVGNIAGV